MASAGGMRPFGAMGWFGERLATRQRMLGLSGAGIARRLGVDAKTYSHLVSGRTKRLPDPELFLRICEALEMTPNQALGWEPLPGETDVDRSRDILTRRIAALTAQLDDPDLALLTRLLEVTLQHHQLAKSGDPD
jgi:transcriptional regulator with XRE-family HTH domain